MLPRPRPVSLAALVAACLGVACAPDSKIATPQQAPQLLFSETSHTVGRVDAGTQVIFTYRFRNAGGLDLSIDNVRAARSCTAAAPTAHVIPPGGEGNIDVTFDTTHEHGQVTRTITVYSNDPAQPVVTLTLSADIDAALAAEPAALYIGHVRRGERAPNGVRLVSREPTVLGPVESTGAALDASLNELSTDTPRQLRVTVKKDAPLGRFKESVLVHTRNSRQPLLTIPVVGIVDPDGATAAQKQ